MKPNQLLRFKKPTLKSTAIGLTFFTIGVGLTTGISYFNDNYMLQSPIIIHIQPLIKPRPGTYLDPRARGKGLGFVGIADAQEPDAAAYMDSPVVQNNPRWKAFVEAAFKLAPIYDYPVKVLLSQAALESGHGTSGFSHDRYNYFGINAVDSDPNNANGYVTPEESIISYMILIKNKYPDAYAARNNPVDMIQAIKDDGYASDPSYVEKIMAEPEWQAL